MQDETNKLSARAENQRQRILEWLMKKPMTTLDARKYLDVLHPSGRVMELKEKGHKIITNWVESETNLGKHRVAQYVLISGVQKND